MNIVIVGGGKIGGTLCADLAAANHDVVVIDQDARVVDDLIGRADITGMAANGANVEVQREAGVPDCDVFIAVTASDEINIISAIIAHNLGAAKTLARVRNPEYASNLEFIREKLGISLMINPELETARAIALSIRFPSALGIETFVGDRVQMVEVRVARGSSLHGMSLEQFRGAYGMVLVCVVQRGEDVFIPEGSFVLQEGDLIHVTGPISDLAAIYKAAGRVTRKIRSVMIVGGNRIAKYLLKIVALTHSAMEVCVIERNEAVTEELISNFPKTKVIMGDGTDPNVLQEQNIGDYDCFVALTGIDEENLVASLYAARQRVPKIITKVNRTLLLGVFGDIGLQTIVTPKRIVSDIILRFVRAMNETLDSKVEAMYRIVDGRVEALQFEVLNDSFATGIPLKDLKLKKDVLIAYIVRKNQLIFPTGNDEIRVGDHLIAVTTERGIDEVDDLLEDEARR